MKREGPVYWISYLAFSIAFFVLGVFVLTWNLTDMQNVGINFWNVLWTVIGVRLVWPTRYEKD